MKRLSLTIALAAAACGGNYKAPPSVPNTPLQTGAALLPFDPSKPGLARPAGMAAVGDKVYIALQNYDDSYTVRGPGLLAVLTPATGALSAISLAGSDGHQCLFPFTVRENGGKLYVNCTGDVFGDPSTDPVAGLGKALVEVDPATAKVTRVAPVTPSPTGVAFVGDTLWFADAQSANVYAFDRTRFTVTGGAHPVPCPTTGTFVSVADVVLAGGDLYAVCSNDTGGILSRLDATTGAVKGQVPVGPNVPAMTITGDGRIAMVSSDNKLRLVTPGSALNPVTAYTFSSSTSILNDVRARDNFLFTVASGSNTVQKLDLTRSGAQMLVGEANAGSGASPFTILPLDDDQALVANQMTNNIIAVGADCTGGRLCWTHPQ